MFLTVKNIVRSLTGLKQEEFFKDNPERDIYLVSYPRSGNTWVRAMLSELLLRKKVPSLRELDYIVPDIHYKVPRGKVYSFDRYVVKSHESLKINRRSWQYKKVIYLVRNPEEVVVSYYRYLLNNGLGVMSLDDFAINFVAGRIAPGSWQEHVSSWTTELDKSSNLDIIYIRYEDLVKDVKNNLLKIANFIGEKCDEELLDFIVNDCSKEGMRQKELKGNRPQIDSGSPYFIGPDRKKIYLSKEAREYIHNYSELQMKTWRYV